MKTLVFDIWGDYAHFGVYYTTSSPLTFCTPPPTAVLGIIGAVLGLEKEDNEYLSILNRLNVRIAVGISNPIKKINMAINHINTKGNRWVPYSEKNHEPRTQINTEMLKNPKYRIWFSCDADDFYETLKDMLKHGKSVYTVSLGLSELLATIQYVDEDLLHPNSGDDAVYVHSIVPVIFIKENGLIVEEGMAYLKERLPCAMDKQRIVTSYKEYLFACDGKPIKVRADGVYAGKYGNVIFTDTQKGVAFCS